MQLCRAPGEFKNASLINNNKWSSTWVGLSLLSIWFQRSTVQCCWPNHLPKSFGSDQVNKLLLEVACRAAIVLLMA